MIFCTRKIPVISIHAPREGSDREKIVCPFKLHISIHAPREGSDRTLMLNYEVLSNFNPRSPRGERRKGR